MKYFNKIKRFNLLVAFASLIILTTSCNKELEQIPEAVVTPPTGETLDKVLQGNADDNLYYQLVVRGNQLGLINNTHLFTMFVPNDMGMKVFINAASGGQIPLNAPDAYFSGFIANYITVDQAAAIVQYNTMPQVITSASIPNVFPNFYYPSAFNPAPNVSALARLDVYPSTRNGIPGLLPGWLNNIPITGVDQMASNGVIHHIATLVTPNSRTLWDRISTESDLTYLKAAIETADIGAAPGSTLQGYLSQFGPDFTVFAPVDTAFTSFIKNLLVANMVPGFIADILIANYGTTLLTNPGSIPIIGTLLAQQITPTNVKGIVVYHVLGHRAFTNNFPTTETAYPTLLNSGLPTHPGVKLNATFGSVPGLPFPLVTSATVTDVRNNVANIFINAQPLTPDPYGTSDQNFLNGTLNKISAVLSPQ